MDSALLARRSASTRNFQAEKAMAEPRDSQYLVDADWLRAHRGDANIVLLDTRPPQAYWSGHLAAARHFDPFPFHHSDTSEAGLRVFCEQLVWIFSMLGLSGSETVVCYEEDSGCGRRGRPGCSNISGIRRCGF